MPKELTVRILAIIFGVRGRQKHQHLQLCRGHKCTLICLYLLSRSFTCIPHGSMDVLLMNHSLQRECTHALAGLTCSESTSTSSASANELSTCLFDANCMTNISSTHTMSWVWPTLCHPIFMLLCMPHKNADCIMAHV